MNYLNGDTDLLSNKLNFGQVINCDQVSITNELTMAVQRTYCTEMLSTRHLGKSSINWLRNIAQFF